MCPKHGKPSLEVQWLAGGRLVGALTMYLWICEFANLCICVFGYFCVVSHVSKTWKTIFGSSMTGWWEVGGCADSNTTVNSAPGNGPHTLPGPSHCTLRSFWLSVCLFVYVCLLYVSSLYPLQAYLSNFQMQFITGRVQAKLLWH